MLCFLLSKNNNNNNNNNRRKIVLFLFRLIQEKKWNKKGQAEINTFCACYPIHPHKHFFVL